MSTVVTVMNMKGGVGKTVVSAHVAGVLARRSWNGSPRKVLLIDYDPQFNLSQMYLPSKTYFDLEAKNLTCRAILQDDESDANPFILQVPGNHEPPDPGSLAHKVYSNKVGGSLHLVPSTLDLMYLALGQTEERTTVFEERFSKFIKKCRDEYDVVIIDCHPAGSLLTRTSLENSDHLIVPVVPTSPFAARGVGLMKRFVTDISSKAKVHILFNLRRSLTDHEQDIRADPKHAKDCLSATLVAAKALSDPAAGLGFVWASKKPHRRKPLASLLALVSELVARLSL